MTLFQGIIEYRRRLPYWPHDVPLDTSIDAMTRLYLEHLKGFEGFGPFNIKVIEIVPTGLTVAGATDDDVRIMRAWRDALAVPLGYRHPTTTAMSSTSPSPIRSSVLRMTGQQHGRTCSMTLSRFSSSRPP